MSPIVTETCKSDDEVSVESDDSDEEFVCVEKRNKIQKIDFLNTKLTSSLDRSRLSNRSTMCVLSSAVNSLGVDLNNVVLSVSSIRRARIQHRLKNFEEIKKDFDVNTTFTVHFDGKIMSDIVEGQVITNDRIAVVVSANNGVVKLLGIPKIESGTASRSCK